MSDRTMELIRGANPYPGTLPPLPIEPVMRRLGEGGSLQPAARHRIPRPNIGGVMVAVSVVAALAIATLAITTLSHRHPGTATGSPPVSSSRQELLRTLGVLRRPQTRTDLLATRPGGEGGELPGIFRVARIRGACRGTHSLLLPCTVRLDTPLVRAVKIGDGYSGGDLSGEDRTLNRPGKTRRGSPDRIAGARALHHHQHAADEHASAAQPRPAPLRLCRQRR